MKISIITATWNSATTVGDAIKSLQSQDYPDIEHVIIDGASTDSTPEVIKKLICNQSLLLSEPDEGIYDALNKGYKKSTGEIIGLLHSDDIFSDAGVISDVMKQFQNPKIMAVYGDLDYVSKLEPSKVIRRWIAGDFTKFKLSWGWMPPHPALFIRRSLMEELGLYNSSYQISGDYDAILRYFGEAGMECRYIPRVLVKMRVGGKSNKSLSHVFHKTKEDYHALKNNRVGGVGALLWKNISKIKQFL